MRRSFSRPPRSGLLLIDKPLGISSHAAVAKVRRVFGQREVGHTGTLDPMATGLLVLALGRATRVARFIEAAEKRYLGTVRLGRATTTYDVEGDTTAEADPSGVTEADVRRVLAGLVGALEQRVPPYSAVKVDGERLYAKARRGEAVEAPLRTVQIERLELVSFRPPDVEIDTTVSKGTYIRTLAVQIGGALGLPAHLAALRRVSVGRFSVGAAKPLDALSGESDELLPTEIAVEHLPRVVLDAAAEGDVQHGRPLSAAQLAALLDRGEGREIAEGSPLRLLDSTGRLRAIAFATIGTAELDLKAAADPRLQGVKYAFVYSSLTPEEPSP